MSRINAPFYMQGKYSSRIRQIDDEDSPYLYSKGQYKTKITEKDLPEHYIKCHSRSFWYSYGYVRTEGVKYIEYSYCRENHLFKDDYIYISYNKPIERIERDYWGYRYEGEDFYMSGNDIITILFAIEKYSSEVDTKPIWDKIQEKVDYLWEHEQTYVKNCLKWDKKPENAREFFLKEKE